MKRKPVTKSKPDLKKPVYSDPDMIDPGSFYRLEVSILHQHTISEQYLFDTLPEALGIAKTIDLPKRMGLHGSPVQLAIFEMNSECQKVALKYTRVYDLEDIELDQTVKS